MSEKAQHTTEKLRVKMIAKYGEINHHKHNKLHCPYRKHWKSHPVHEANMPDENIVIYKSSGLLRALNLHKTRTRTHNGRFH